MRTLLIAADLACPPNEIYAFRTFTFIANRYCSKDIIPSLRSSSASGGKVSFFLYLSQRFFKVLSMAEFSNNGSMVAFLQLFSIQKQDFHSVKVQREEGLSFQASAFFVFHSVCFFHGCILSVWYDQARTLCTVLFLNSMTFVSW